MKIMLIGAGAREHSLGWKLAHSPRIEQLISVPGNPGLESLGQTVPEISASNTAEILEYAIERGVDLVLIGPEDPLARGLVDDLKEAGIAAFGPTRAAARLESSKWFGKEVMAKADVATAQAQVFRAREPAVAALRDQKAPFVVKADGLAAGKGVLVTDQLSKAEEWVGRCLSGGFGSAGSSVLIEEYLAGPELSLFAVCDGEEAVVLAPARDYKRLHDGDQGPNTGGMGAYSPVELPPGLEKELLSEIVRPVLAVLRDEGTPYLGFLYVGLVLTDDGPKVLEFNVRLGDPEAQVILPRLQGDLLELILACLEGGVGDLDPESSELAAVNVVLASEGYPESPRTGDLITGLQEAETVPGALVFHAGTRRNGAFLETAGGRVLNVVGTDSTLETARKAAYRAASHISWPGIQFRQDIAGETA